jgi:hypothetical protein
MLHLLLYADQFMYVCMRPEQIVSGLSLFLQYLTSHCDGNFVSMSELIPACSQLAIQSDAVITSECSYLFYRLCFWYMSVWNNAHVSVCVKNLRQEEVKLVQCLKLPFDRRL